MGTRNLTCIYADGTYKVAKYCQWDGYPEGQGKDLLKILKGTSLEKLKENLNKVIPFSIERYNNDLLKRGLTEENLKNQFISFEKMNIIRKYLEERISISRDVGAEIVKIIAEADKEVEIHYDLNFAADSLFCEWCYVVDLDKNTLEVFVGFNKKPLKEDERFYFLQKQGELKYYPVKHLVSFDLKDLPNEQDFLNQIYESNKKTDH